MKNKLAIFDIDGTIFRSSLLIEVVQSLIEEGIFPRKAKKEYKEFFLAWLERRGDYDNYIDGVVKAFEKNIKGVSYKDYQKTYKKVIDFHKDRVYVYTRELIKSLKKKGYYILAISHSPKEFADDFCKNLGFDKVYGRIYEVYGGKFTGKTLYEDQINDKAKILLRAVSKNNLSLKDSIGVGDTQSDIKFLKLVKTPICFNPNKKLYKYARKQGWKVVVERKDVIYVVN